jgi:hypothetical protein
MSRTISQGLRHAAKLKGELKDLLARAASSVSYQEDQPPAFNFNEMMEQASKIREELVKLDTALLITNATTTLKFSGEAMTLTEAVRLLQETKSFISWLRDLRGILPRDKVPKTTREYNEETEKTMNVVVNQLCDLPEAKRVEAIKVKQGYFDALNDAVETTNHKTELRE